MSGFFDTDHKAISVVIGLGELLDAHLNSVVLDHLIADNKLVVEPDEMKLKVDEIIKGWTRKRTVLPRMPILWSCQYMSLNYVSNDVFSGVIKKININELLLCVNNLPNDKAAGLSGIFNKLWKHCVMEDALEKNKKLWLVL
ncbi:hypothetical protein G9A89_009965 [Geosiphon pyriformis]|nr:hypothetical protein G9A89_009965 [Geosiphon pyriformis]